MAKATPKLSRFAKRHYEAIAEAMQSAHPQEHPELYDGATSGNAIGRLQWTVGVKALADMFAADNSQFKRERFISACQPGANVRARTRYTLPEGVTVVGLGNPKELHDTIAEAVGERARS
jgi:hypothetical protein